MRTYSKTITTLGLALALTATATAHGQQTDEDLAAQVEALRKGQEQISKDLQEIKKLLQERPAARPAGPNVAGKVFDIGANPVKGPSSAKLTLVEFTDYQ
jgi:protein-disulfide isomerase